jgi:methylmalonyl-CoA mutase cobalamin-binding domain/chain
MSMNNALVTEFTELFLSGDSEAVVERTAGLLDEGLSALGFFQDVFTPAMEVVGGKFGRLEIFLPELLAAGEIAQALSEQVIQPGLQEQLGGDLPLRGRIILASVKGDLHDIGKNMVGLMLQVNGFEVIDMGVDVDSRSIIDRALEVKADIIGLSSLMTTSMPYMKEVVELVEGLGYRDRFSVIVGGAPINPEYSNEIGADAFGKDAVDAVNKCVKLMNKGG